ACGLSDVAHIESLQEKSQCALEEYCRSHSYYSSCCSDMAAAALSSLMASTSQFTQFQNTLNFVSGGAIVAGNATSSSSSHISTGSAASVSSSRSAGSTGGVDTHTSSTNSAGNSAGAGGSGSDSTASCTTTMDGNEDTPSGHVNSFNSTLAALAGTSTSQTTDHVVDETTQRKMRSHQPDLPAILMGASHVANLHLIDDIDRRGDSKIFVRKREEHKLLVNHLQSIDDYGKRYKLMKIGIDEILRIIREEGGKLRGNKITSESEFPKLQELINALAQFLENTCLFGEIVLHFPDMSYRILKNVSDWRTLMTDALNYSKAFVHILDEKSIELLNLLNQEINEDQRTPAYVNPYRETASSTDTPKLKSKKKSKSKKGPSLSSGKTEL
uniref:Uncharacterized protein n=1 Tax=Anopheles minimus TaxID=112268 RepID=A0A182VWV6_9DIPT